MEFRATSWSIFRRSAGRANDSRIFSVAVDSRVGQKGNTEECNFPRVHFEDPRVVWPMNRLVKPAQGPRSMIDTSLSRGRNSAATASMPLSIASLLASRKNEFPESAESLISMECLSISTVTFAWLVQRAELWNVCLEKYSRSLLPTCRGRWTCVFLDPLWSNLK